MPIRPQSLLVALTLCLGCATPSWSGASPTRAFHVPPGTPLVVRHELAELSPVTEDLVWLNPLVCFPDVCRSSDQLCVVLSLGCFCVVGAVDVVILPPQALFRWADRRVMRGIAEGCGLPNPAQRVAEGLAAELTREFDLTAAPPGTAAEGEALILEIRTLDFTHGQALRWHGELALRHAGSIWIDRCDELAPPRDREALRSDCAGARSEVEALAGACVSGALERLRADSWREPAKPPPPPPIRER